MQKFEYFFVNYFSGIMNVLPDIHSTWKYARNICIVFGKKK